jgi:hypothetical protein
MVVISSAILVFAPFGQQAFSAVARVDGHGFSHLFFLSGGMLQPCW